MPQFLESLTGNLDRVEWIEQLIEPRKMRPVPLLLATAICIAALFAAPTTTLGQPLYKKGEVVVQYRGSQSNSLRATGQATGSSAGSRIETLKTGGRSVAATLRKLRRDPRVVRAVPDYIATVADFNPNDPGFGQPGDWRNTQWNFLPGAGVDAPTAWDNLIAAGRPGGAGVKLAVLDTGVAYKTVGRFKRAPDLETRILSGYDFVGHDSQPLDENGHGTHVAEIIGARVNNAKALTGLAYGVKLMPVRVLDASGQGSANDIAQAIRYAARRGVKVINLSLQFDPEITMASIPQVSAAVRYAHRKGAIVVAAAGNFGSDPVALPARVDQVVAVGATTDNRCLAEYSNTGLGLDLVAPGGGDDSTIASEAGCNPARRGPGIFAQTYRSAFDFKSFKLSSEEGTSEAAPHVSAVAALVIASGVLGASPSAGDVEHRLENTASDLGQPGYDSIYGYGLLNAGVATDPNIPN